MSDATRIIWHRRLLVLYAAAIGLLAQHLLASPMRYSQTIIWPELANILPWPVLAITGSIGFAFGLWAYPRLLPWMIGAAAVILPGVWLGGIWLATLHHDYDITRHRISAVITWTCLVLAVRAWFLDRDYGRQQLNAQMPPQPKRRYRPLDDHPR
ncbi:MAG: hypothetical protein GXY33_12020 [Phycisphaerae bacterium]|nr:hypothetical protein [Phycisphaerae bacterium]